MRHIPQVNEDGSENTLSTRLVYVRDRNVKVGDHVDAKRKSTGVISTVVIRKVIHNCDEYISCSYDYLPRNKYISDTTSIL